MKFWRKTRQRRARSSALGASAFVGRRQCVAQLLEIGAQPDQEFGRLLHRAKELGGHRARAILQRTAGRRHTHVDDAFVSRAAHALDVAERFQPLQQRRDRGGIEVEPRGDVLHGHVVALPQHEHREILGIGQRQLVEQRLVRLRHRVRSRVKREAQLLVERLGQRGQAIHGSGSTADARTICTQIILRAKDSIEQGRLEESETGKGAEEARRATTRRETVRRRATCAGRKSGFSDRTSSSARPVPARRSSRDRSRRTSSTSSSRSCRITVIKQ